MDGGLDWTGLDWIGLDWIGLDWIGLDWIGLDGWMQFNCGKSAGPYTGQPVLRTEPPSDCHQVFSFIRPSDRLGRPTERNWEER
ncbi:hypothetical protein LZ31DRAFT_561344 [Colletotrichum somersetense]|nr:hypothetical protein LZ31DRAFT_561344 [Colletotrichum somersetense]